MIHGLKCWPEPFEEIWQGRKRCEIRRRDELRQYAVGHTLWLREWSPATEVYLGRNMYAKVCHIVHGPDWGLPDDLVVMSVDVYERWEDDEGELEQKRRAD